MPIDESVLTESLHIMRELRITGHSIGTIDSMIAATARLYGLPFVTDNVKHFKRVPGIEVRSFIA